MPKREYKGLPPKRFDQAVALPLRPRPPLNLPPLLLRPCLGPLQLLLEVLLAERLPALRRAGAARLLPLLR